MPASKPDRKTPASKPSGKPASKPASKRSGRPLRRVLVASLAIVLILLGGVWFFGPPLIGAIARPIVERRANAEIDGTVSIERLSLAWTGAQRAGPIELFDTDGGRIARIEAEVGVGLLRLALGGRDLGEIVVVGRADFVRLDDGRLNIERALHPMLEDDGEDKPDASIPPSLRARLRLDGVEVTYADPVESPGRVVGLRDITGSTTLRAGEPLSLTLNARPVRGPSIDALVPGVGSIELSAEAGDWSASDGRITADRLTLAASVRAQRLETAFLRVLLPLGGEQAVASGGRALAAFDPVFDLAASIEFSPQRLAAEARLLAEGAEIGAAFALADGVAQLTGPTGARIRGERVMAALPEFADVLAERADTITLDEYPSLEVTVDALRLDVASPWSSPRAQVSVRTGPMRGTIMPPASERLPFAFTGLSADAGLNEQGELDTRARAGAVLADRDAGSLIADISMGRVVSPEGFGLQLEGVSGTATVSGLRTDLLEVFLGEVGAAIAGAIGPQLDFNLEAGADEIAEGAGRRLKLSASAERLNASGAVRLLEDRLTGADEPLTLSASGGAELAEAILGDRIREAGYELVRAGGGLSLSITSLDLPLDREAMTGALVAGRVSLEGWTLRDANGRELGAETLALSLDASRAGEGPVSIALDSKLKGAGRDFGLKAELGLGRDALLAAAMEEGPMLPVVRSGSVELRDLPLRLIEMVPADLGSLLVDARGEPVDIAALAESIAGPTLTARGEVSRTEAGRTATLVALSRDTEMRLSSELDRAGTPAGGTLALTVRPEVARDLLNRFAPELAVRPELAAPTRLSFAVEPTPFPLGAGPLQLSAGGALGLRPISIAREAGAPLDLGPIELRELAFGARFAPGWNEPPVQDEGEGGLRLQESLEQARLGVRLQRPGGAVLGVIDANAQAMPQADGDRKRLSIDASRLDPAWLDAMAGLDGLIASALGGPGRVALSTSVRSFAEAAERGELSITLESPLASTPEGPVRVYYAPESISLAAPAKVLWDGQSPSSNALLRSLGVERALFVDRLRFDADVQRLTIPRGAPLFDPDRFGVDVRVRAVNLAVDTGAVDSGAGVQRLGGSEFGLRAGPQRPGRLDFSASLTQRATGPGRAELSGSLAGYAPGGVIGLENATVDLNAQLTRIPTDLIDDLTVGGGLLREIIGPELSGEIRTAALSRAGGTLSGRLASDRASVGLSGRVREGAFSLSEPAELAITRFGPDLMARGSSVMPLIGTIEKRAGDLPAVVRVSSMSLPLDGNLSRLDAAFSVDLGSATFTATPAFEGLLRAARWEVAEAGARRIAPLQLTIDDGVLEFADFQTQIAGGPVRARGRIDLGRRTRDIVIVLPLDALSQSTAQRIRREAGPLGAAADTLTAIPFRIDGPLDAPPNPRPDLQLLIEEGARELLNPENVIRNIFDEILRPRREGN